MVTRTTAEETITVNKEKGYSMTYKYLGQTGIKVSVLSYGTWLNQVLSDEEGQKLVSQSVKACWERGINFFDTAEYYMMGKCDVWLGNALRELGVERKDYVVTAKVYWGNWATNWFGTEEQKAKEGLTHFDSINDLGLSRKHIIEGCRASLKRLKLDYVDVLFAHRPDYNTPLEEQVRAFSWCVDQGLAHYWATSEWPALRIEQACQIAEKFGLHKPVAEQTQYNVLDWNSRDRVEKEYRELFETRNYGTTVYSPLCAGFLCGKYNQGTLPDGSRGALWAADAKWNEDCTVWKFFAPQVVERTTKQLQGLAKIAADLGCTQAQLALAWVLANQDVSTAILGFSRVEQLDENIKALEVSRRWTPELEKQISECFNNHPEAEMNWRTWGIKSSRRPKQA